MEIRAEVFITILGMALVTYATRMGGLWLLSRFTLSKRVMVGLEYMPGAVIVAIIIPDLLKAGLPGILASLVTLLIALQTKNMFLSLLGGVGAILLFRSFL